MTVPAVQSEWPRPASRPRELRLSAAVSPARVLGEHLAAARRNGATFDDAWPAAITHAIAHSARSDDTTDWKAVLEATRSAWSSAWDRAPATPQLSCSGDRRR